MRVTDVRDLAPAGGHTRLGPAQPVCLFVETPVPPQTELQPVSKTSILLFLKLYNPKDQTLKVSCLPCPGCFVFIFLSQILIYVDRHVESCACLLFQDIGWLM